MHRRHRALHCSCCGLAPGLCLLLLQGSCICARLLTGGHLLRLPPHGAVQAVQLLREDVLLPQHGRPHRLERRGTQLPLSFRRDTRHPPGRTGGGAGLLPLLLLGGGLQHLLRRLRRSVRRGLLLRLGRRVLVGLLQSGGQRLQHGRQAHGGRPTLSGAARTGAGRFLLDDGPTDRRLRWLLLLLLRLVMVQGLLLHAQLRRVLTLLLWKQPQLRLVTGGGPILVAVAVAAALH
mmetsp:Transcript_7303/g.21537  ORF Transcript_7303/g.21537 Transcript_7303/m.21537 type:complete len:234 (-) Transcript_7303:2771-3472(-)